MQTIDEEGNVLFWTVININGGADRLILGKPSGDLDVIARKGGPCPTGGSMAASNTGLQSVTATEQ